jgi:hypothetical protein
MRSLGTLSLGLLVGVVGFTSMAWSQDASFKVAEGKLSFTAPKEWTSKKPATRIVDVEFEIPAAEGDERPGRMTVMGAGGSVKDNIDRWFGQFTQPGDKKTADVAKVEKLSIAGQEVHYVDVAGDYDDKPGPFVPGVKRANYRMLAAIVVNKDLGQYFLKFYGPKETVAKNEKQFRTMLESMKVNP